MMTLTVNIYLEQNVIRKSPFVFANQISQHQMENDAILVISDYRLKLGLNVWNIDNCYIFININVIIIAAKYEEFCRIDDSCQVLDSKTLCDKNLNVCKCNPIYAPDPTSSGHQTRCIGNVYLTF